MYEKPRRTAQAAAGRIRVRSCRPFCERSAERRRRGRTSARFRSGGRRLWLFGTEKTARCRERSGSG